MNPASIAKLRRTFIAIATASFLVVILFVGGAASFANITALAGEASRTIDAIIDAGGQTPGENNFSDGDFHEEASFGLRFFAVTFDEEGEVVEVELSHVASIDYEGAIDIAETATAIDPFTGLGRYENYLFKRGEVEGGTMVVFLDCSVQMSNARAAIVNTLFVCVGAVLVAFTCVCFFSRRAVRSEVENVRRQQRFMTNASHELKTPIAVIRANTELIEMMSGETEWTQSTMRQVERLDGLVANLMTIVRGAEQAGSEGDAVAVDVSQVVGDAVESFRSVAQKRGIGLKDDVARGVALRSNPKSIEQLACLLVDNALKYCDAGGSVFVALMLSRIGRGCTLTVSNDYAAGRDVDYQRFFDRFYREDEAHENQQGYGIGLSVAESICKAHHGSIKASWKSGIISFTCVLRDMQ